MAIQDQCGDTQSNRLVPPGNGISLNANLSLRNGTGVQPKDHFSCGNNDYSPKARKPYTITKQRERWTEDEHKKFLEALKLYGRAWRRIEEHVGTKTAVQIRSHAQKFFSKVVRESSGSNISSVELEPIEIPPPRPKRKPMHPYPRKMVHPLHKEPSVPELPQRSSSPILSISEQENQSPTSVLSAVGSDVLDSTDSNPPNRSLSPDPSSGGVHLVDFTVSEPSFSPVDTRSPSSSPVTPTSTPDEPFPKDQKLDSSPKENLFSEGLMGETSTRSLKLFGKTVLVTEYHRPSSPTIGNPKWLPSDMNDGRPLTPHFLSTKLQSGNKECTLSHVLHRLPRAPYFMQVLKDNSNLVEAGSGIPLPWTFYGGIPFPFIPFHKEEPVETHLDSNGEEVQDKEIQKEGSWTSSNTGSLSVGGNVNKNVDGETQNWHFSCEEKEPHPNFEQKLSQKSAALELRASTDKRVKGFVPYRKRMADSITTEGRDEQRIRLCL